MTFDGFDIAPLIEGGSFTSDMIAAPEPEAVTLDAALNEAARAERAAIRAEATMLDLWLDRPGGINLRALERPGLGAQTSWHAWAALAEDGGGVLDLGGGKDVPLFAAYGDKDDELEGAVVKGSKSVDEGDEGGSWGYGDGSYGEPPAGGGGGTGGQNLTESSFKDCEKDNKALDIAAQINALPKIIEYGAVIFKDANGDVLGSAIAYGTPDSVSPAAPPGIGYAAILGQIHSHSARTPTGNQALDDAYAIADMYPSPTDWEALNQLALQVMMAGGNPDQLSIYIVDPNGVVREFNYSDRGTYNVAESVLLGQSGSRPPLPAPMVVRKICGSG